MTDIRKAPPTTHGSRVPRTAADGVRSHVASTGALVQFMLRVVRDLPVAVRLYPAEIVRHIGLLIRAASLVVLFMAFMMGAVLAVVGHFHFSELGIESYVGATGSAASMRGVLQVVFGWIIAGKVGCGIVAEVGAMRINDEIDAMEVMGVRSVPYLAGTRVAAGVIVFPLLWIVALAVNFIAGYLINVTLLASSSEGAFSYFLFLFQNLTDFTFALLWGTTTALIVILVACYYGFTAHGGPVGVGRNTTKSMLVNLILVSILALLLAQLFYGNNPNAPIGN